MLGALTTLASLANLAQASPAAAPTLDAERPELGPICPSLPSSKAAYALVAGDWGALTNVVASTAFRAVLIGAGMALLGERKNLARNAIGGALGIEAFVLAWAWYQVRGPGARSRR